MPALSDRTAALLLLAAFSVLFAYFFQGGGWNQNARFDTVRAIVETGSLEITPYAANTGDISRTGDRIYANKPPGLSLLAAPAYAVITLAERAAGADLDDPRIVTANAHLLTFWVCGLPAALLVAVLFAHFRRRGTGVRGALALAAGFGSGTLLLPYSGVMMSHAMLAFLLFASWHLIADDPSRGAAALAGALMGAALLIDYLAGPLIVLYALAMLWPAREPAKLGLFLAGPALALAATLGINLITFSKLFTTSYGQQSAQFVGEGLLLGVFHWPEWARLYWLSFHPFRGLFYCCPLLLLGPLGILRGLATRALCRADLLPLAVVAFFVLFNLTFNAWTGGWGIGPRYLIPATPFLYAFAHLAWQRHRVLTVVLIVLSTLIMVAVSAVTTMIPANNTGPPAKINPVRMALERFLAGEVSVSSQGILDRGPARPPGPADRWDSYNLGEAAGLRGTWSLLPLAALAAVFVWAVARLPLPAAGGG